jgi:hypothetical protein
MMMESVFVVADVFFVGWDRVAFSTMAFVSGWQDALAGWV